MPGQRASRSTCQTPSKKTRYEACFSPLSPGGRGGGWERGGWGSEGSRRRTTVRRPQVGRRRVGGKRPRLYSQPMSILFLNRDDVEALLPMDECIEVVEGALRALARGEAVQPLRSAYWMPDRHGLLVVMPGMLGGTVAGVKVLTVVPENHLHGEESHQGMVLLFEQERG